MTRRVLIALLGFTAAYVYGQGAGPAITGQPYSADEKTETVRTLADGTHITVRSDKGRVYRDSEGRTREEQTFSPRPGTEATLVIIINDPIAHTRYILDPASKTGRKTSNEIPRANSHPAPRGQSDTPEPKTTIEKLGTETIEGVLVEGKRHTTVWPAGSKRRNDQPITEVSEAWRSPELQVLVLSKNTDPERGETTHTLTNISRAEPDPSLFQPPADCTLTDH
ncbi:MAG TPA: hypothetical protein VMU80_03110 [Bryobacteraceae bacterium]|nr:hypothetical protein [Bryobacteraceae bacterium]